MFVFVPVFVLVLVLQQAATYSITAVAGNWTILVVFCPFFVCPSRYVARHRKPRRCVYALNLGGTGISLPDSFSYHSNFRFRSRSSSSSTTSGDIFYCSGSRQLNHSSLVATVILVLVLIRFQNYNFSFYSVLVLKIILVLASVLVNDW